MIKLVMCLHRHPEKTREEFQEYWLKSHGPFFMKNAATMRVKKYVQSHTINTPLNDGFRQSRGMMPEYDGIAEVWFESEEELMEVMSSPEMQDLGIELKKDEETFIDHSKSTSFIVKECEF